MGTVHYENYVWGSLTDANTVTVHVTRTDTSADVVAAGTAMTHTSTGVYDKTFTEPAAGLTYSVVVTVDGVDQPAETITDEAGVAQAAEYALVNTTANKAKILLGQSIAMTAGSVAGTAEGGGTTDDVVNNGVPNRWPYK